MHYLLFKQENKDLLQRKYEASIGLSVGLDYYFNIAKNIRYYIGLHGTVGYTPKSGEWLDLFPRDGKHLIGYIPIGLQYMNSNGFTIASEIGVLGGMMFNHSEYDSEAKKNIFVDKAIVSPGLSVKLGYHF